MTEEKRGTRSMDEILADIDAISSDPEHRDQFKALKMLASTQSSAVVLPPPLGEKEIVERLMRVMRPSGPNLCQIAFSRSFPRDRLKTVEDSPKLTFENLSDESLAIIGRVSGLKSLYREFPAIKRHGIPAGFPSGRGVEAQLVWCKNMAKKMLLERERNMTKRPNGTEDEPPPPVAREGVGPASGDGAPPGPVS